MVVVLTVAVAMVVGEDGTMVLIPNRRYDSIAWVRGEGVNPRKSVPRLLIWVNEMRRIAVMGMWNDDVVW